MAGRLLQKALHAFDSVIPAKQEEKPEHQRTGQAGEEIAYFHLQEMGYTFVARNYRARNKRKRRDRPDWVGWRCALFRGSEDAQQSRRKASRGRRR